MHLNNPNHLICRNIILYIIIYDDDDDDDEINSAALMCSNVKL